MGQHTASNTGWTPKERPWEGSRKAAARIEDRGHDVPAAERAETSSCEALRWD